MFLLSLLLSICLDLARGSKNKRRMNLKALRHGKGRIPNSRWAAYAVASAATSLAGLATGEAEIHYSGPVNFRFKGYRLQNPPLENGASLHFFHNDLGSGGV